MTTAFSMVRFAAAGDVHGNFVELAQILDAARRQHGPLDFVIGVGDGEPNRDETDAEGVISSRLRTKAGTFPLVASGAVDLGAPFLFIAGNNDPYPALDAHGPGPWTDSTTYLGRVGLEEIAGLTIGFLSGIYAPSVSEGDAASRAAAVVTRPKARTYWVRDELDALLAADAARPIDVLVTHDWPNWIGTNALGKRVGNADMRRLTESLQPRLHLCGHIHHSIDARIGSTRVVGLTWVEAGPESLAVFETRPDGSIERVG